MSEPELYAVAIVEIVAGPRLANAFLRACDLDIQGYGFAERYEIKYHPSERPDRERVEKALAVMVEKVNEQRLEWEIMSAKVLDIIYRDKRNET